MRRGLLVACLLTATSALAACTSSAGRPTSTTTSTQLTTLTTVRTQSTSPTPSTNGSAMPTPVDAGPIASSVASSCPLLATQTAALRVGMRLDRVTVQRADDKTVGCEFYALQHPNAQCDATCLKNEHLPPGNQAVVEIRVTTYRSQLDAHNAFALVAAKGAQPQRVHLSVDNVAVCYQTPFYPKDQGKDWACAFSLGTKAVVVRTVATISVNARAVSEEVALRL